MRGGSVAVGALLLATFLSGCSESEPENPYAADFEQARTAATTDFERQILADDVITDAEFDESRERMYGCLRDLGYVVKDNGEGYSVEFGAGADASVGDAAYDTIDVDTGACQVGTTLVIEPLRFAIASNPEKDDTEALLAECLVRHGVRDEGYTKKELAADEEADAFQDNEDTEPYLACLEDPRS